MVAVTKNNCRRGHTDVIGICIGHCRNVIRTMRAKKNAEKVSHVKTCALLFPVDF